MGRPPCWRSVMRRPAWSCTCRVVPRPTSEAPGSRSPGSWRHRTANSRSARPRPTSASSEPAAFPHRWRSRRAASASRSRVAWSTTTGRLVAKPKKATGGDLSFVLERDGASSVKVMADVSSRIETLQLGATYRVTGVVGQRATRSGALDGYRIWVRDPADLVVVAGAAASPSASPGPGSPSPGTGAIATVSIARALKITDRAVAIDATVTAPATLLDASGRRIVVQDASAAVELLLPTGSAAPPVGTRIHAEGRIGVAYGAPRLRVDRFAVSGTGSVPAPLVLHGMPGAAHEWRLVTVSGRVLSVNKLGDRWRAEIAVGNDHVVVVGQPGAGIPSTTMVEGRTATVTGIARRPAPTASDHRFAVTPRFPADVRVTGGQQVAGPNGATTGGGCDNARRLVRRRRDRDLCPRGTGRRPRRPRPLHRPAGPGRRPRRRPAARRVHAR